MTVPMLRPISGDIMTQYNYERNLGNDISLYKKMGCSPIDEAVQAVREVQDSCGKGIWENKEDWSF